MNLLNEALDDAILSALALSGDELTRLLLQVRQALAEEGVELVLLIEDFAKLQGIDRPLLQGLLERGTEGGKPLAPIRTALACTTGYYRRFVDTVRTRVTFRVDLNVSQDVQPDLPAFASRYLNAARVGTAPLIAWHDDRPSDPVPNACTDCPFQGPCHDTFGHVDGRGLYPFNGRALAEASRRTGSAGFNPREFITKVLRYVTEQHARDLEAGEFPPPSLRDHLPQRGRTLGTFSLQQSQQRDPENHPRRVTLVELWSDATDVVNLDPTLHDAFSLPPIQGVDDVADAPATPSPPPQQDSTAPGTPKAPDSSEVSARVQRDVDAVRDWGSGEKLDQKTATKLRDLVFPAVIGHLDWNAAGLLKSKMAGDRRPFRTTSIVFDNQVRDRIPRGIAILPIPVPGQSTVDVAIALEGLLLAEHHGHWSFPQGGRFLRAVLGALDAWSGHLVDLLRRAGADTPWDPAVAAIELLALMARLQGRPVRSATSAVDRLDAAFDAPAEVDPTRSPAWQTLVGDFAGAHTDLLDVIEAHALAAKGDSTTTTYLDAARLLGPIARLARRDWIPAEAVPDPRDLPRDRYRPLAQLRNTLQEHLPAALAAEADRYVAWIERFERDVDPDWQEKEGEVLRNRLQETLEGVRAAAQEVVAYPLGQGEKAELTKAVNRLGSVRLKYALDTADRVRRGRAEGTMSDGALLGELGADLDGALGAVTSLLDLADSALRRTEAALLEAEGALQGGQEASGLVRDIGGGLERLATAFDALAVSEPASPVDVPSNS